MYSQVIYIISTDLDNNTKYSFGKMYTAEDKYINNTSENLPKYNNKLVF